MALAFMRRAAPLTEPDSMPPPPAPENPFTEAERRWAQLHDYAVKAMENARAVAVENRQLVSDNTALGRQIQHLMELNTQLLKDNRVIRAYATAIRTRVTVIREASERADQEALEYAHNEATARPQEAPEETAAVESIVHGIERINAPTMPPTNEFRR